MTISDKIMGTEEVQPERNAQITVVCHELKRGHIIPFDEDVFNLSDLEFGKKFKPELKKAFNLVTDKQ